MKDQDERHELLGRLETPPEFKDWASNTLPTPGISNGHQTMAEGRGTSEHERLNNLTSPLRGPADTGRLSRGGKKSFFRRSHQCPPPPDPHRRRARPPAGNSRLPARWGNSGKFGIRQILRIQNPPALRRRLLACGE